MSDGESGLKCPSAQPDFREAQVLGLVERGADGPRVAYVAGNLPSAEGVAAVAAPVPPTLVMRFAGACQTGSCVHYDGRACRLVERIVDRLDPVAAHLPACAIRADCRWYAQEGAAACHRCPQVVTRVETPDEAMLAIAEETA